MTRAARAGRRARRRRDARDLRLLVGRGLPSPRPATCSALTTLALTVHELTHSGLAVSAFLATTDGPGRPPRGARPGRLIEAGGESRRVLALASGLAQAGVAVDARPRATDSLPAILVL